MVKAGQPLASAQEALDETCEHSNDPKGGAAEEEDSQKLPHARIAPSANGGTARDSPAAPGAGTASQTLATARPPPAGYQRPKHYAWADLLQRTFAIDVLACPDCGGRLRLLATIEDQAVIEKILRHLGLPIDPPTPALARVSGVLPGFETSADRVTE